MNLRAPDLTLRSFCNSVAALPPMSVLDAAQEELRQVRTTTNVLGHGLVPKKGTNARQYVNDLQCVVSLFTGAHPSSFRAGFTEEAGSLLDQLSQTITTLKGWQK